MFGFRRLSISTPRQDVFVVAVLRVLSKLKNWASNQILENIVLGYRPEPTGSWTPYSRLVSAYLQNRGYLVHGDVAIFRGSIGRFSAHGTP